jgi:hypothetical protein
MTFVPIARGIMGRNFLSIDDVRSCFGVEFVATAGYSIVPFSEATLQACKDKLFALPSRVFRRDSDPPLIRRRRFSQSEPAQAVLNPRTKYTLVNRVSAVSG